MWGKTQTYHRLLQKKKLRTGLWSGRQKQKMKKRKQMLNTPIEILNFMQHEDKIWHTISRKNWRKNNTRFKNLGWNTLQEKKREKTRARSFIQPSIKKIRLDVDYHLFVYISVANDLQGRMNLIFLNIYFWII